MKYISFNEIIGCNAALQEQGLHFKVHLQDSCGKQICRVERLGNCACEGKEEEMCMVVEKYFEDQRIKIVFDEKRNYFCVRNDD